MIIERAALDDLGRWLARQRRKPLVLRGARQVGKSTLVREFAAGRAMPLIEVNLERHLGLERVLRSLDVPAILGEFEALTGVAPTPPSLLFLDEVQAVPQALQALRYLHEERPDLPIIAAGSLLEFTLADHSFPMPVGRIEYGHLGPMTFREFVSAVEPALLGFLSQLGPGAALPSVAHRKLLERQREYLFVGGMPEAVAVFRESASLQEVATVHRSIAQTYVDDFAKYARGRELALLQRLLRQLPRTIGQKVKYSNLSRDDRARDVRRGIDLLAKARLCTPVHHSSCSGVPLLAGMSDNDYKLLLLDIGLVNHLLGNDWLTMRAMTGRELVNEGGLAEQLVGQHLIADWDEPGQPRLCYWLREGKSANAEVDYVWSRGDWVIPIEVKAGSRGALRSLHQFVLAKDPPLAVRFDLNPPSMHRIEATVPTAEGPKGVAYDLLSLPLYAVGELPRLVDQQRERGKRPAAT